MRARSAGPSDPSGSPREDTLETLPPPGEEQSFAASDTVKDAAPKVGDPGASALDDDRYEDLCLIGEGGFGEVRRVLDRKLGRTVAMKLLHAELTSSRDLRGRLANEAKLTARLQHPGIVGVYDFGERADGRIWITMPEVHGRTLAAVLGTSEIEDSFAFGTEPAPPRDLRPARERGSFAWSHRRLLDAFARVCQAVAFAHREGVIHRDLKPDNIMLGDLGEVLVMDWGLARAIGDPERPSEPRAAARSEHAYRTRAGDVLGTPAYMAPEQARGEVHRHGPALDIYALGAILYHLLSGRPPFVGSARAVIARVVAGPPPPLATLARSPSDPLADLFGACEKAMAREPEDRYADATLLASEVLGWLDGVRRRERALTVFGRAGARRPDLAALHDRAESLRNEARALLSQVKPYAPADAKAPAWDRFDEADRIARDVALGETEWVEAVQSAIAIDPSLDAAHQALADHYKDALERAESTGRDEDAVRFEARLRAHDRGRHAAFLRGDGALTIHTDPPGATAVLRRFVERRRRLVPDVAIALGSTPIRARSLPRGSYLVELSAPGRATVRYPVCIGRGEHWDGCPPGGAEPFAIPLPRADEIDDDEIYIPAGWTFIGGDPEAPDSLARRRVWIDGFVLGRFPVTNARYIAFLDDLVARGLESEALLACPRSNRGTVPGADEHLAYDRAPDGRFLLREDDPGEAWDPNGPVALVTWRGAVAYARWLAARTGRAYRLPHELEREKAARGADARRYPWGNAFDPSWACMLESQPGDPGRADVHAFPADESPYGARGLAGNTRDLCSNPWRLEGPKIEGDRLVVTADLPAPDDHVSVRGGAWSSVAHLCGAAGRFGIRSDHRRSTLGLRVARSYP